MPTGWEFDTSSLIAITPTNDIVFDSTSITPDATSFSFEVTTPSTFAGTIIFGGLKVRPTGTTPSTGNMTYSGDGIDGVTGSTNFGTLSTVAGTVTQLVFTTQPGGAVYGSLLSPQPTVKTQDQFGNDSTSELAANLNVTVAKTSGTGDLVGDATLDIGTGVGNGTVTFTNLTVNEFGAGKQLTATATGLTSAVSDDFEITQKTLTATLTADNKVYDGLTSATITGRALVGLEFSDVVTVTGGTATFDTKDVGTNKVVSATGLVLGSEPVAPNYIFNGEATGAANITPLEITITPNADQTKIYGEDDPIEFTFTSFPDLIAPDDLTGALSRVAGEDVNTYAYEIGSLGDGLDNYSLTLVAEIFEITPKTLAVSATGVNKVYDADEIAEAVLSGDVVDGDEVTFGYTATFSDKNVGTGKPVSVTVIAITGGDDAGNYILGDTTTATTADITPAQLTVSFTTHADKTYNGNNIATITGRFIDSGIVGTEDVAITDGSGSATFTDKHVGTGLTATATGFTLTGADKNNYEIGIINTTTGNVNQRPITVTAVTDSKIYNGTEISDGEPTIENSGSLTTGPIMGDDIEDFIQTFDTKHFGTGKVLTPSGVVVDGNPTLEGSNYTVTFTPVSTGEIIKAPLTATVTVEKKVVNGTTDATIVYVELISIISVDDVIDDVTISDNGIATFDSPDVGIQGVTATGITLAGDDAGNYDFDETATGTGEILAVPTTVYVDDDWAGEVDWTDPDDVGDPATYFGYDAFATIQEAIDAVEVDGTVNVLAGIYTEDIVITKGLILQGADKATTKIKGIATEPNASFPLATPNIDIQADGVTISEFTIESPDVADGEYSSGVVLTGQNITITNNAFVLIQAGAPPVNNDSNTSVAIQTYSKAAVPTSDVSGLTVSGNTFNGTPAKGYYGVYVNPDIGTDAVTISGNTLTGHIWRAITTERSNTTISGNTITNTDTGETWGNSGIRVVDWGTAVIDSVSITGNTITGNGGLGTGILFGDSGAGHTLSNIVVTGNTITGSDSGVVVHVSAEEVSVNENTIQDNTLNLNNTDIAQLDSINNYWGTAVANTIDSLIDGEVDFDPYYVDSAKTILSSTVPTIVSVDDGYTDGTSGSYYFGYNAFATIQEAIDAVEDGGTVNVAAGSYTEGLTINKRLTLQGEESSLVTVTGNQIITASSTLDSFTFNGTVTIDDSSAVVSGGTISNNVITGSGNGIRLGSGVGQGIDHITIRDNEITGNSGKGIAFYNAGDYTAQHISYITIDNNQITNNTNSGISTYGPGPNTITNNTVSGNTGNGISIKYDDGDVVTDNIVADNTAMGINMHEVTNSTVERNTVSGHVSEEVVTTFWGDSITAGKGSAIYIHENSNGNTIRLNTLINNKIGVLISRESAGSDPANNSINNNSITGNTVYGVLNALDSPDFPADATQNWWGSANGPTHADNPTGTGDTVSDNVDYRPWHTTVEMTELDTDAPTVEITSTSPTNTSPIPVTVIFSESVFGFEEGDLVIDNNSAVAPGSFNEVSGSEYEFTIDPESDGTITVSIAGNVAWDLAGNFNTVASELSIEFDATAPILTTVSIQSDNTNDTSLAKVGDEITLTIVADENISQPTVTIAGNSATVTEGSDAKNWTATYVAQSGDAEGVVPFTINFSDIATNLGTEVTTKTGGSDVTFDGIAPGVPVITSIADDEFINNSEKAAIVVAGTAEADSLVSITLSDGVNSKSGTQQLTDGATGFSITIDGTTAAPAGLTDGIITPSVTATDAAGNVSDAATTPTATKDTSAPSVTSKTPDASAVGVDPTSNITVVFSENVVITADNVTGVTAGVTGSGTNTATINPTSDLANNTTYTITLTGVTDTAGNALPETSWTFTTAGSYSFTLTNGWNLVALGVVPNNNTVSTILGGSSTNVESIWSYDAVTNVWSVNHPNDEVDNDSLLSMTAGTGYWVNYTSASPVTLSGAGNLFLAGENTPPSRTLKAGWNLIGYYQRESNTTAIVTNALKTLKSQDSTPIPWWSMIVKHDNSAKQFGTVENSESLSSGQGYWILMGGRATDTYIYAPGIADQP